MREYAFELALCAHLERDRDAVVARQLGGGVEAPGNRVVDVVLLEPGPAFDERARLTPHEIPAAAIESDVGPGRARGWRDAIDRSPEYARRVVERGVEVGFFERERRGGREHVRQAARYPDEWFDRLIAVENKPDLGAPGDLRTQLRKDVSLGLFDAVVLATESHVTGAHLNRIPDEVGVWRVDGEALRASAVSEEDDHPRGTGTESETADAESETADAESETADAVDGTTAVETGTATAAKEMADGEDETATVEVVREPDALAVDELGVELLEEHPGRSDVAVVDADAKARARRRLAERAYGKGWRPAELPGCAEAVAGGVAGTETLPYCEWKGRLVDPAGCGPDCAGFELDESPPVAPDRERAARSPWVADPEGATRRQSGLDRFTR